MCIRDRSLTRSHICRVITFDEQVLAFHIVCKVADELHILNIVVATQVQGIGLGHVIMQDIVKIAQSEMLKTLFLEVRASNETAQALYLKWQFEQIALRKGYYRSINGKTDQREDALVFARSL